VRPRPSLDLLLWGFRFWRAAAARAGSPGRRRCCATCTCESRALFEELDRALGGIGPGRARPAVACAGPRTASTRRRGAADYARSLGLPAEVLTRDGGRRRSSPTCRLDVAGAVRWPLDGHLVPGG
jgi:hypothetical protein